MILPVLIAFASQSPSSLPSPVPAVSMVLELKAPRELSKELEAEITAQLEKAGLQVRPGDATGIPVLRISATLETRKDGSFLTRVTTLCGTREELEPRKDEQGRPAGPWPRLDHLILVTGKEAAQRRLKEGAVEAALRATRKYIPPPSPPPAPASAKKDGAVPNGMGGSMIGGVPGGVVGGVIGGSGKFVDFDFEQVKVRFQPPAPPYPALARIVGIQGEVRVDLSFDVDGVPTEAELLSGPGLLAETAMAYGMQWRFEVPVLNGKKVPGRFRLVMPFHLK